MNGSCAGGSRARLSTKMATLLNITPDQMNELAKDYEKIYTLRPGAECLQNRIFSRF